MASYTSIALTAVLLISCAISALATAYTVGDTAGWTTGNDYSTWAAGKAFVVGDSLVFNYAPTAHTVNEVMASDYSACSTSNYLTTDNSGATSITLNTPGTHYFLCGIPGHCASGMKLSVSVSSGSGSGSGSGSNSGSSNSPPTTSTPSMTPPSTATTGSGYHYAAAGTLSPALAAVVGAVVVVVVKLEMLV